MFESLPPLSKARGKILSRLLTKKYRQAERLFLAEGVRLVEEAVDCGVGIKWAVATRDAGERARLLIKKIVERKIPVFRSEEKALRKALDVVTPQAVAAVCLQPEIKLDDLTIPESALVVVCDGLKEPGNLGAVVRVAAAAGADAVLTGPDTVDIFNPKALRGSMGAMFRMPVIEVENSASLRRFLSDHGFSVFTAALGGENLFSIDRFPSRTALVLGSEAEGSASFPEARRVSIPMAREVESLNVAVAAGIILYEIARKMDKNSISSSI
jgi:TrmH family RNA methyltransferase